MAGKRGPRALPRYRKFTDSWEVKVGGKYVPILDEQGQSIRGNARESEDKAYQCWRDSLKRDQAANLGDENDLAMVFDLFLDRVQTKRTPTPCGTWKTSPDTVVGRRKRGWTT